MNHGPRPIGHGPRPASLRSLAIGISVLALLVGLGVVAGAQERSFSDDDGSDHEPAVDALADEGILDRTTCGDGLFCPDQPILRWTMAVWLVRALGETAASGTADTRFADVDTDMWWSPYVERLADLRITRGCAVDPLRFCPESPVTPGGDG